LLAEAHIGAEFSIGSMLGAMLPSIETGICSVDLRPMYGYSPYATEG
jgi:hypothetical protein